MTDGSQRGNAIADGGSELVIESETGESTTRTLLRSVAAMEGVDETDLEPLYESVEVSALEELVRHAQRRDNAVSVRFTVDDHTLCVRVDETVQVVAES